jgi:hypothetical protein
MFKGIRKNQRFLRFPKLRQKSNPQNDWILFITVNAVSSHPKKPENGNSAFAAKDIPNVFFRV